MMRSEHVRKYLEQSERIEELAWWFVRYAMDEDFKRSENQNAYHATAGNINAFEAQLATLLKMTEHTTLPWKKD